MDRLKFYARETLALLAVAALVAATVVASTHLYVGVIGAFWPDSEMAAALEAKNRYTVYQGSTETALDKDEDRRNEGAGGKEPQPPYFANP
jgi:hypothetical protein